MKLIEDMSVEERQKYFEERKKRHEAENLVKAIQRQTPDELKYRGEQVIIVKINGLPVSTTQTLTEYAVRKVSDTVYAVRVGENIAQIFPEQYKEAMTMMNELEEIKSNVVVEIESSTGKIARLLNHKDIVEDWKTYKSHLLQKYSFVRSDETRGHLNDFILLAEKTITDEKKLIREIGAKMFFFMFFDSYLVTPAKELQKPYDQTFYSQLFENVQVELSVHQSILKESPEEVVIGRNSKVCRNEELSRIKDLYETRYRPQVRYGFTQYDAGYSSTIRINTASNLIEEAEIGVNEEVVNNIELTVSYKCRKIK